MAAYMFLDRNGLELVASEADAAAVTRSLAAGEINQSAYAAWLRQHVRKIRNR